MVEIVVRLVPVLHRVAGVSDEREISQDSIDVSISHEGAMVDIRTGVVLKRPRISGQAGREFQEIRPAHIVEDVACNGQITSEKSENPLCISSDSIRAARNRSGRAGADVNVHRDRKSVV